MNGSATESREAPAGFDEQRAASYDSQWAKLAPMKAALHLCTQLVLGDLRADARILCVGAGTGAEVLALAQAYPEWTFTVVEPSAPMLSVCRQHVEAARLSARCEYHEGYLSTLPATGPFDAATSILVSQFLTRREDRSQFFREIAERLNLGGYLVTADLASDTSSLEFQALLDVWKRMLLYVDMSEEHFETYMATLRREVAVERPAVVEALLASSGFERPVRFCQTLLIHAWYARRAS